MKNNKVIIAQIAATYIGTVIGAGFATGQEILQFFTLYGFWGIIGIMISAFLFIWLGMKMMVISHRIQAYSYQEFNEYLFGKSLGTAINGFVFIILLGVTAVMISGTGAIFAEQLHLSAQIGIIITLVLCFIVMLKGLDGIFFVNSLVVPMMLLFTLIIAVKVGIMDGMFSTLSIPGTAQSAWDGWKWLVNACIYAAFNLAMAQAVLVPLGREVKDEKLLKWGAIWGGLGLGVMLFVSHVALESIMPEALQMDIPIATVIEHIGWLLLFMFLIIIYGEIFTTLIGNVFGIARQIQHWVHFSQKTIVIMILLISYLISQIEFSALVTYLYPLFGYIGLLLLIRLAFKRIPTG